MNREKNFRLSSTLLYSSVLASMLASCSGDVGDVADLYSQEGGAVEVVIAASKSSTTRTELDPNDLSTVKWSVGDKVAIWATGESDQTTPLDGEEFTLRYYGSEYDIAEFSSTIEPMSEDQSYSYMAFYPHSESISGTTVNYEIPSSQSGEYDGTLDFRVADAVTGSALSSSTMGGCTLSFRSLTHILKISIPEGYNNLGVAVKELQVTLPADAAGVVSFDMNDTEATPTIGSSNSQTISLLPSTPIDAGDGQTLWLFINPMSDVTGTLSITGIGVGDELAYSYDIPLTNHTFAAGRITPVYTAIGEEIPSTTIELTVSKGNLGEELTYVHLTAPTGGVFKGGVFNESGENTISIANDGTGLYKASYTTDYYNSFNDKTLTVEYESENALVTDPTYNITLGSTTSGEFGSFSFTRTMPYLLYQNFGSTTSYAQTYVEEGWLWDTTYDIDNPTVGDSTTVNGDQDVVHLSSYGLSDWYATRVGISGGTAVRICSRYQSGASIVTTNDSGQIISPSLSWIKEGATINVTYNYKGGRWSKYRPSSWTADDSDDDLSGNTIYSFGVTKSSPGSTGILSDVENSIAYATIPYTSGSYNTSSQNYNDINQSESCNIDLTEIGNNIRLVWTVSNTYGRTDFLGANGNFWLYLDNIVVTAGAK